MTHRSAFATLVFRGKRFDGAAMPLEALPELAAYRDLLAAVAREFFFAANPGRVRLPKGFADSFRLSLTRIEPGSAIPIVERELPASQLFPVGDLFDTARDEVAAAVEAVSANAPLPSWLTPSVAVRFASFGRTLKDDEAVVLAPAGERVGAEYNRHVRRRILLAGQGTYEEDVDLIGVVREADADQDSFEIRLGDDRRVPVRVSPSLLSQVLRSFQRESAIRVSGIGVYDPEGKLLRVSQASDVSAAEEGDVASGRPGCRIPVPVQVDSLKGLQDGWLDGEGVAFCAEALAWSSKLLESITIGFELATPHIYPTPAGGVRAEWSRPHWEISAELDWSRKLSEVRAVRLDADEMIERTFALSDPGQEVRLGSFLATQMRGEA
ncbi:MAG TPA: hypothetical protein VI197_01310 [Polyangiaceae bacterium]